MFTGNNKYWLVVLLCAVFAAGWMLKPDPKCPCDGYTGNVLDIKTDTTKHVIPHEPVQLTSKATKTRRTREVQTVQQPQGAEVTVPSGEPNDSVRTIEPVDIDCLPYTARLDTTFNNGRDSLRLRYDHPEGVFGFEYKQAPDTVTSVDRTYTLNNTKTETKLQRLTLGAHVGYGAAITLAPLPVFVPTWYAGVGLNINIIGLTL
jgi:hypothetical protein